VRRSFHITHIIATSCLAVAIIFLCSCHVDAVYPAIDKELTPVQQVHDMMVVASDNGAVTMRMSAPLMQRFQFVRDSTEQSYEYYPETFNVDAYTVDGQLETNIHSKCAKHITTKSAESWSAFGDVVITNYIKGQVMTTDTIYWNREEKKIYTDCYVKLDSPQGLMQGYGMESDERANNCVILNPFDSYTPLNGSDEEVIDSINFLGPMPLKKK